MRNCYFFHTTYRKNNNLEKCAGMGLNGFYIQLLIGTRYNWKNQNPGSYQLNSTANPAHLPQNWAKLAKLAVLFNL